MKWVWVSLPYATFGLGIEDGKIVEAPPIARWVIGKSEMWVASYYRRKGATFIVLDDPPTAQTSSSD